MDSVIAKHLDEYSQKPLIVVEVPGVSVLFGEFADYCSGYSVCMANDMKLLVAVSRREDGSVKVSNSYSGDHKRFSLSGLKFRKEDRWGNYVKGVLLNILNSNLQISGLNISLSGSLLACDPETVSSAVGVGVALAINSLFDLKMTNNQIIRHVYLSNTVFCQEGCKYMTILTMMEAQENMAMLFDNQQVMFRLTPLRNNDPETRFLVFESRIPPLAMREEKLVMNVSMRRAFAALREHYPKSCLRDVPEQDLSERVIKIDEEARQICSYVIEESKTAFQAFKALEIGDLVTLGKLMGKAQKGLRDKLDLTCPEVDWLVKRANEIPGCMGACMIPTGLSGSILMLMQNSAVELFASKLIDYEHIFGFSVVKKELHSFGCAHVVCSL